MITLYPKCSIRHLIFIFWLRTGHIAHIPFWWTIFSIKNGLKKYFTELKTKSPFWLAKRWFLFPARVMRITRIDQDWYSFTEGWLPRTIITHHDLKRCFERKCLIFVVLELIEWEFHSFCTLSFVLCLKFLEAWWCVGNLLCWYPDSFLGWESVTNSFQIQYVHHHLRRPEVHQ